jgi:small conductance mechanosensitive channel
MISPRFPLVLILIAVFGLPIPESANGQPAAAQASVAAQPAAPGVRAVDPAEAEALAQAINDPAARAKLTEQLNLLAAAERQAKPAAREDLGTRLLRFLVGQIAEAGAEFGALGHVFVGLPAAARWIERQMADPVTRGHWEQLAGALASIVAAGAATIWLSMLAVRRPRRAIENHGASFLFGRFLFCLIRLLLDSVPIGLFGVISYFLLSVIAPPAIVGVAAITFVNATMVVLLALAVSRFLFAPGLPNLRLIPVSDGGAWFLHRWARGIGALLVFGWFGVSAARVLGLPATASQAAFKIVGLLVTICLVTLVFRRRRQVAQWIRGGARTLPAGASPTRAVAFWSSRRRFAEVWHLIAAGYIVIIFAIWALDLKGGFDFLLRGTIVSIVVLGVARIGDTIVNRAVERGLAFSHESRDEYPRLREQAGRYLPILRATALVVIWGMALLGLVEVWGLDIFDWFETSGGRTALARTVSISLVVVTAVVAWEFVSALIERYLLGAVADGSPIQRSQRIRTLLPLLRNAFLIFLIVVVVLIVLSEVGLNIAPLLAGAGVVGLAIGFGAQTLVKDVITGVFILFENTIAVGDVVDVGSGHSGLVEAFSIRTMKLRDTAGSVHTVPFSAVTSVVNMTKEFAYYVFNIKVDYAQDTDSVVEVVKALGAELQADPAFADLILAPIEIIGVDSFGPDAVILQARFKTRPIQQWNVGREFNRRMKKRFDALNIPLSFSQSISVLTPAGGKDVVGGAVDGEGVAAPSNC